MRRVVITGIGAVTPVGLTFDKTWASLKVGVTGVAESKKVDVSNLPWKMTGEIKEFDASSLVTAKEERRTDLFVQYALASALDAVEDASVEPEAETAVLTGSSRGGITMLEESIRRSVSEGRQASPYLMPATTISMAPSCIARRLGLRGYISGLSNACASGSVAVGEAFRLIRSGYIDTAISGGAEAPLCRVCMEGYGKAGALSKGVDSSASRPFDKGRDGFVLSEGASILFIEEMDHALERGARIYAEIAGYANLTDGYDQTKPVESGEVEALRIALKDAGLRAEDIDLINAHGTSTPLGDRVEAGALRTFFGGKLSGIPVTANKSMTGHMLAASGSLEIAATAMSIHEGIIPPTLNLADLDPECALNIVTTPTEREVKAAISSSFGFGGVNAVIILKRLQH